MPDVREETVESTPLIGRLVHLAVQLAGAAGPAWLGWEISGGGVLGGACALLVGAVMALLWFGVYAPADPEPARFGVMPVNGRLRIVLEIMLIIIGGIALWLAWNRAAGETYLTAAFIDFVVRYPRLFALYRDRPLAADSD